MKVTSVPLSSPVFSSFLSESKTPLLNSAVFCLPSRNAVTLKYSLKAFTAFVPTPLSPTLF